MKDLGGIGKSLFAKEFAKAILCLSNEQKPCNKCKTCIEFENSNNPDFLIVKPDENVIKNEKIREMTNKILEKPIESSRKVYMIDDSECMTKEAQNSLLKTLEEPPQYVTIILIISNENLLLNTIKSRCTKIVFNKIPNNELISFLQEQYNYKNITENMIQAFDGSIRKALELKDKPDVYLEIEKIFLNLNNSNIVDIINSKDVILKNKEDVYKSLEYINVLFFSLAKENCKYIKCMEILEKTKEKLKRNCNYDMTIDNFLLSIWEEING